jgi:aminopeptidase-like protein
MLWVLNQSDGEHSLLDVARRSGLDLDLLAGAAERLVAAGLLAPAD